MYAFILKPLYVEARLTAGKFQKDAFSVFFFNVFIYDHGVKYVCAL